MYKGMQLEWLKPVVGRLERLFSSVKKYAEIIKNATECYTKGISVFYKKQIIISRKNIDIFMTLSGINITKHVKKNFDKLFICT